LFFPEDRNLMGRLLRKKTVIKKKKKKETEEETLDSKGSSEITKKVSSSASLSAQKDMQSPQKTKKSINRPKFIDDSIRFLREVKMELKKVSWPGRTQTVASTGVVIVLVFIVAVFLGVVDISLSSLLRLAY
jgi:preprotein translocase subunit SecE